MMMWTDLTLSVTKEMMNQAGAHERMVAFGHLGTHFDVMNLTFPLENALRSAAFYDLTAQALSGNDLILSQEALSFLRPGDFAIFYTGTIERIPYGTKDYFSDHPQLSDTLVDELIERGVAMIGIDAAGIRRGSAHTPKDQYCADHGVFVVENLCNLASVLNGQKVARCDVYTFPVKFETMSGLPCRVLARL
jgi:kynurenine formamidase